MHFKAKKSFNKTSRQNYFSLLKLVFSFLNINIKPRAAERFNCVFSLL